MKAVFDGLCPNCGGPISDDRLMMGLPCEECLPQATAGSPGEVAEALAARGRLWGYGRIAQVWRELLAVDRVFKSGLGHPMWALQRVWAKRVLLGKSFAIVAPTGVGKTTFGSLMAVYLASKGKRSYIVLPSSILVRQVSERIREYAGRCGIQARLLAYYSGMKASEKREFQEKLAGGEFDILVTTDRLLASRYDDLKRQKFDFIFVDDVDALLKRSKNLDRVLVLLGLSEELVQKALESALDSSELEKLVEEHSSELGGAGILVFSSASARRASKRRLMLLRSLLGFELGYRQGYLRNIVDVAVKPSGSVDEEVVKVIKRFGGGVLVFTPMPYGREYAEKLAEYLKASGVKAELADGKAVEKFSRGELDALVGIASHRSPLARGVDLPERIRYVVFAGVPRYELKLTAEEYHPARLYSLLSNLRLVVDERQRARIERELERLRSFLTASSDAVEAVKAGGELTGYLAALKKAIDRGRSLLKELITPELLEKIRESKDLAMRAEGEEITLVIADAAAYLQASGRASRLFPKGLSKGASILVVDDEKAYVSLVRRLRWYIDDLEFKELEEASKAFAEIDEDRRLIRELKEGKASSEVLDFVKNILFIVESPTKARVISRLFGEPMRRDVNGIRVYEVASGDYVLSIVASGGHVLDLATDVGLHGVIVDDGGFKPVYAPIARCLDCGEQFVKLDTCPRCGSKNVFSKARVLEVIRELAIEANGVFIATDPDTEGEKIAWDIASVIAPYNGSIARVEFHEVTRKGVGKGLRELRGINERLVEAQIVRRIEDRWIGFELSRKLWKKFSYKTLSAGRVQTPVLGWVIQRAKEAREKVSVLYAQLPGGMKIRLRGFDRSRLKELKEAKAEVEVVRDEVVEQNPPPPYTTDALLRDASAFLKFSAQKTMQIAQDLFEMGLITYHRTDATTVSQHGMSIAREYIEEKYPGLFQPRSYAMEGAHECIRPTRPADSEMLRSLISMGVLKLPSPLTREHYTLYQLIFNRFIASQMKPAKVRVQHVRVKLLDYVYEAAEPVEVVEEGYSKVWRIRVSQPWQPGSFKLESYRVVRVSKARPYTQGELVAEMKKRGIGRPSTYAKIVETLLKRRYVFEKNGYLFHTPLGYKVWSYLRENYGDYVSEETTAKLEEEMDKIERGEVSYLESLSRLYREILRIRGESIEAPRGS